MATEDVTAPWHCDLVPTEWGVHVWPGGDAVDHDLESHDCICGPDVQWVNHETDESYPAGPLVVHHSLDGREAHEDA